jgi:preprotein translocase subunit SecY
MYGGSSTHIPLKVNTGGVIPVIFASSILAFPATLAPLVTEGGRFSWLRVPIEQIAPGMPLHDLLYVVGIIFFCYFYTAIIFNPDDVAENMRKYGGSSTHIPLKVNTGGVIPVIFASSILAFPGTLTPLVQEGGRFGWLRRPLEQIAPGMPLHDLLYIVGIVFFCYFYTAIIFNPDDVAENMRKYGGFIPGIRPGKRTAEYIDTILTRITLVGAIYLAIVAILPQFLISGFKVAPIPLIGERLDAILPRFITEGMNVSFYFGGTSLLIIVGVAMDTVQQVESQLIMRHYDGFMKKTRIRGRRGQ